MAKKIATWIIVPLMVFIFVFDIFTVALSNHYRAGYTVTPEAQTSRAGDERIHFLNVANSDAILIESDGHFALIDSGEGDHNPRRKNEYRGYETDVLSYLYDTVGKNGAVHLDFVLATHYHYDHVGAFHAIFTDENITIDTVYLKKYDAATGTSYEPEKWGLQGVYEQLVSDALARGFTLVQDLPSQPFEFGGFTVQFFNTVTPDGFEGRGENASSVGIKMTKGERCAFLAADITSSTGLEPLLAPEIGDVDLLKIGHHGYFGSSSPSFLRTLKPEIAIVTNQLGKIYPNVKWNLALVSKSAVFATYDNDGIIATFTDGGDIVLTNKLGG